MDTSWLYRTDATVLCLLLAVLMVGAAYAGAYLARRGDVSKAGMTSVETGLLGLLGLLLAFTFSGAASRYDARGNVMIDTANAIRGVILRADLYPEPERGELRGALRDYVRAQIALYEKEGDAKASTEVSATLDALELRLWSRVSARSHDADLSLASTQMMNALDRMFGLAHTRAMALRVHIQDIIMYLLFAMAIATMFASGFCAGMGGKFHGTGYIGFALLTALVIYVTLDLDRPGRGFIRRDTQEQALVSLLLLLDAPAPNATAR